MILGIRLLKKGYLRLLWLLIAISAILLVGGLLLNFVS
jgi:hypothetical protein